MDGIRPIPTWHGGVRFRSRLEAKWAMLFEHLGWPWLYEPTDYGGWIPDFVLTFPDAPLFVEVKPFDRPRKGDLAALQAEIEESGCPHDVLLLGACGPWPEGTGADEDSVAIGVMGEWRRNHLEWAPVYLTGCRGHLRLERPCREPVGSIGLYRRSDASTAYRNRRCGCTAADHRLDRVEWSELVGVWARLGNVVQWEPEAGARTCGVSHARCSTAASPPIAAKAPRQHRPRRRHCCGQRARQAPPRRWRRRTIARQVLRMLGG